MAIRDTWRRSLEYFGLVEGDYVEEGEYYSEMMGEIVQEALSYSNQHSATVDPNESLLDFFENKVEEIMAKGGTPARPESAESSPDAGAGGENEGRARHTGLQVNAVHEHDPDVIRDPSGAPRGPQGPGRGKERPPGEKRPSTVTRPVTEDAASIKKDDLISSFGKRLENGGS